MKFNSMVTYRVTTGFRLVIEFIDYLEFVTISNYSAIANSHPLQFTAAHVKPFQSALSSPVVAL
jgi:hypothetical protein